MTEIKFNDIFLLPNLMSLSRVILTVPLGYFLAAGTDRATLYCAILICVAGLTDFLDGLLARLLNQKSRLGLYLDPLADKILTVVLLVELIFTRNFPLWLAILILGRDTLIVIGGLLIKKKTEMVPPSLLTGKYYFASVAILMGCYIIRFEFGVWFMQIFTIVYLMMSTFVYCRQFIAIKNNRSVAEFKDKTIYKIIRIIFNLTMTAIFCYRLYTDLLTNYL